MCVCAYAEYGVKIYCCAKQSYFKENCNLFQFQIRTFFLSAYEANKKKLLLETQVR